MFEAIKKFLFKSDYKKRDNVSILLATINHDKDEQELPSLYNTPLYTTVSWRSFALKAIIHFRGYRTIAYPDICYNGELMDNPPYITQQILNAIGGMVIPINIIENKYVRDNMNRANTHFVQIAIKKEKLQDAYDAYKKAVQQLPIIGQTDVNDVMRIYAINLLTTGVGSSFPIKWYPRHMSGVIIPTEDIPEDFLEYLCGIDQENTIA